jgi:glyoxylase-like metal-dependent hydrolase (beta-lactamase superfamily II)
VADDHIVSINRNNMVRIARIIETTSIAYLCCKAILPETQRARHQMSTQVNHVISPQATRNRAILSNQVAGFQRRAIGDFIVTALYDGTVAIDPNAFEGVTALQKQDGLKRLLHPVEGKIDTSVNAFVVDTGSRVVLIDAGSANIFGPTMGRLMENLKTSGYAPEDVDTVLLTHLHPDHVGGIADDDGNAAFVNATVWAAKADADFWLDTATAERIPEQQHWFIDVARNATAPYIAMDRFKTFIDGDALENGIFTVEGLPGHTPGHSGFRLRSGDETIFFWGDVAHLPAVQLLHPAASIDLDIIPELGVSSRRKALADAAHSGGWIAAAHAPFPGIGRIREDGDGYTWIPAEYGALPVRG